MRFSATAVARARSNAVGALELECREEGLGLSFLGVAAFQADYAPGAVATGHQLLVPWMALSQARAEGPELFLEFDAKLAPHNRLTLIKFNAVVPAALREVQRQRWILLIGVLSIALSLAIAAVVMGWRTGSVTPVLALVVCAAAASVILVLGLTTHRRLAFSPISSEAARLIFVAELARFFPKLVSSVSAPPVAQSKLQLPTFQTILPRTTLAIVITLTSASLGAVLTARWILTDPKTAPEPARIAANETPPFGATQPDVPVAGSREQPHTTRSSNPSAPPTPRASPGPPRPQLSEPQVTRVGADCQCPRPASALWEQPIERLSILALSEKSQAKGRKNELVVDVGIVNNGNEPLSEISLTVRFFSGLQKDRRFTEDRVLYFAGPLTAGKAIKWRVEGEGSEFEVENPVSGDIGPGGDGAAPADRFFDLLEANHRPVRMHGAMMLAYLADPRANEAILKLRDALRDNEGSYLQRLLWTQAALKVCHAEVRGVGDERVARACVYNSLDEPQKDVALRWRALESPVSYRRPIAEPPLVLAEMTARLTSELPGKAGIQVEAPWVLEGGKAAAQFEVYADRVDLLP